MNKRLGFQLLPFFFGILIGCSGSTVKQTVPASSGEIRFEEERYYFGKVSQGAVVEHIFKFKNIGTDTLLIDRVETTCGCTAAIASANRIAPGDTGQINVRFDTGGKVGAVNKPVFVFTNGARPVYQVDLYGEIELQGTKD
jgi:hypothetical protein